MKRTDQALVTRLRKLCMAFPDTLERPSHGEPTWRAGKGRVFAVLDNHHHGAAHLSVWAPMPPGMQHTLIEMDGDRFFRPPYVGPSGWVGMVLDTKPEWALVEKVLREAWLHVAGVKLRARLAPAR